MRGRAFYSVCECVCLVARSDVVVSRHLKSKPTFADSICGFCVCFGGDAWTGAWNGLMSVDDSPRQAAQKAEGAGPQSAGVQSDDENDGYPGGLDAHER